MPTPNPNDLTICYRCQGRARFTVAVPIGSWSPRAACTRHLAWLVIYMTTPGRYVTVTNIAAKEPTA